MNKEQEQTKCIFFDDDMGCLNWKESNIDFPSKHFCKNCKVYMEVENGERLSTDEK